VPDIPARYVARAARSLITRGSTSWASAIGAVTRMIGSSGKKIVPSGIACTSPVKRSVAR
jgi:hypothetical protein